MNHEGVDIKQYILEEFVPAKLLEPTLETINCSIDKTYIHAQQKCTELAFPFARSPLKGVKLKSANNIVTSNDEVSTETKNVVEIIIDVKNFNEINYEPGDTIGILPRNSDEDVAMVLRAMQIEEEADIICNLQVKTGYTKKTIKVPQHIPTNTTVREVLQDCINLHGVLKKQFLRALAEQSTAKKEKDFLNCLSSKEGSKYYNKLILEKGLTILNILKLCETCKPTLELLVEHLPRLLPRPYSIANSPLKNKHELRVLFSSLKQNPGVTTNMLNKMSQKMLKETANSTEIPNSFLIYFREINLFRYTAEDVPLNQILISVGTGVAPFVGFLEHKEKMVYSCNVSTSFGQTWLYAGARNTDYLPYRKYFLELQQEGAILDKYYECFSQMPDADYHYMQDLLKSHAEELVQFFLLPQTVLYICADGAKISKSIEDAIAECFKKVLEIDDTQASDMIKDFRLEQKYREDLWT